jgi:phosphopantothenoylcysteine synthetase/decarboxylase
MGYALATEAVAQGWTVDLVSGPVALAAPRDVRVHPVISAGDMFTACEPLFAQCDLFIAVAAVADYRPKEVAAQKQKKHSGALMLELVPTVDILKTLSARRRPGQTVVGFAAETNDVEAYARRKLAEKRLDWIVANDVGSAGIGMNADDNAVLLIGAEGTREVFGPAPKADVARFIFRHVAPQHVAGKRA